MPPEVELRDAAVGIEPEICEADPSTIDERCDEEETGLRQRKATIEEEEPTTPGGTARERMHALMVDEAEEQKSCRNDLLLVYLCVGLDFMGVTLIMPSIRFLVLPTDPGAFDDIRDGSTDLASLGGPGQAILHHYDPQHVPTLPPTPPIP